MSAFVVSRDHVAILGAWFEKESGHRTGYLNHILGYQADGRVAEIVASELWAENVASVNYRYDRLDAVHPVEVNEQDRKMAATLTAIEILGMLRGLEYQSCEHPNYRQTTGFRVLDMVRNAAINALPGMDDAPWCESHESLKARRRDAQAKLDARLRREELDAMAEAATLDRAKADAKAEFDQMMQLVFQPAAGNA